MTSTTTTPPPDRRALLGALGGVLWVLSPVAWLIADIRELETGTASFVAVWATYVATLVIGPLLVAVGHRALPTSSGGRTLRVGAVLAGVGLTAFAVGGAVELGSLAAGSGTSVVGYVASYVGFLVAFIGSLLVGIAVLRGRWGAAPSVAGWLLVLAIPAGIAVGLLFQLVLPGHEAGFYAAVGLPTATAWILLGRSLATAPAAAAVAAR